MRTREAEKLVLKVYEHDWKTDSRPINTTRYYRVVNRLRNGEVRIDTYACRREGYTRNPLVKCVQRCYSNSDTIEVRDIWRSSMGGFQVDFSDMTRKCRHYAECYLTADGLKRNPVGKWNTMKYEGMKTQFLLWGWAINDYAGTNYEHSGIDKSNLHPMRFFQCYRISKSVEFLAKAGMNRFITPSFVKRLRDDRETFNFFRSHFNEIKSNWRYGIDEVQRAIAHKCSLEEAADRKEASEAFKKCNYYYTGNIPKGIDRYELWKWCNKNDIRTDEYRRYAKYIARIGENLSAYGVTYPRDFAAALENAEKEAHRLDEIERRQRERAERRENRARVRRERMERKDIAEGIKAMAKRIAALNGIRGYGYAVVIPKSAKALLDEGNAMKNCIGRMGYDRKIAAGQSLIFFLRGMDGKKNVDVEVGVVKVGKKFKLEVLQCYNPCNQRPPEEAFAFARELADKAAKELVRKAA